MKLMRDAHGRLPSIVPGHDRLSDLTAFGSNPGQLRARTYTPANLREGAPLVVVLHGCTQTAADYDYGSGWSSLADGGGFAVLFPEQQRSNNPNLCFNWFVPGDSRRDDGEPLSIKQMVETFAELHRTDRQRIFVTGLSAGGAMAANLLATYPDVFAGAAIIAGLPYGCAKTVPEAFDRMKGNGLADGDGRMRDATDHTGPWPIVSVWHGTADQTVHPANAEAIVRQWRTVHGLQETPTRTDLVDNYPRRVWCDPNGRALIEMYSITGMGHERRSRPRARGLRRERPPYARSKHLLDAAHRRVLGFDGFGELWESTTGRALVDGRRRRTPNGDRGPAAQAGLVK